MNTVCPGEEVLGKQEMRGSFMCVVPLLALPICQLSPGEGESQHLSSSAFTHGGAWLEPTCTGFPTGKSLPQHSDE